MALLLILIASLFISVSNAYMRKSIDAGGTAKGYLVFQMAIAFFVAVFLGPVRTAEYQINLPIVLFGGFVGLITAGMLFSLGRALEKGPLGLTFSILNASTVLPGVLMALLFGSALGFPYTAWHGIGSLIVLLGLFWAGSGLQGLEDKKKWIFFSFSMFLLHTLILCLFQYRALLLGQDHPEELFPLFTFETIHTQWFMPSMFFFSGLVQLVLFLYYEKRRPYPKEITYGVLGGVANGLATYFMISSTEVANPLEKAIIFPLFSVVTIFFSNLWGQRVYRERINWKACQLSIFGLVLGTVDWKALAAAIGF